MIIVFKPKTSEEDVRKVASVVEAKGLTTHIVVGEDVTICGVIGDTTKVDPKQIEVSSVVERVMHVSEPYKLANRAFHPDDSIIDVSGVKVGGDHLALIAGPCSVESKEQVIEIAKAAKAAGANMLRGGAFKPRTSPYAFQGMGTEGLDILVAAKEVTGLPIVSELMSAEYIDEFNAKVDLVQIGARNMQNFDLLKEVGRRCTKPILLKRGLSATFEEWVMSAEYIMASGNPNVILCERGVRTFETYTRNTLDLQAIPVIKKLTHLPIIIDPSHAGGKWWLVEPMAKAAVAAMNDGDIVLLENTRYRAEETKNGEAFSKELASLCDVFVNDAFGTAHRAHCSNVGVTQFVDTAVVGYLMQKEIDFLGNAVENPERPFVAILGGSKVSSKISVINNLLEKVDTLIIGGGMCFTFTKAQGGNVGKSLLEEDYLQYALDMIEKAKEKGVKLLLPVDAVAADEFSNDANIKVVPQNEIPEGWMGLDIGPETAKLYAEAVKSAKTVVWNGPMGCFEMPNFANGTETVAKALSETDAVTIIGGGDSAAAVNQLGYGDKMTHISTGGGASLEFLEGKELPGVAAANDK